MKANYQDLRVEHGAFIFTYVPSNVGNIRQITTILPKVKIAKNWENEKEDFVKENEDDMDQNIYGINNIYNTDKMPTPFRQSNELQTAHSNMRSSNEI